MTLPISDAADRLIVTSEVSSEAYYTQRLSAPSWAGGASGVTIGFGYDLGYEKDTQIVIDWVALADSGLLHRLSACAGVRGWPAKALAASLSDIRIPWALADAVHRATVLPRYIAMTEAALPNCDLLSPDSFGALVSLVYNRGPAFGGTDDRHREMRAIKAAMQVKRFDHVAPQIAAMRRIWQGQPGMAGLLTRRAAEAQLFEQGLGAVPVVSIPVHAVGDAEVPFRNALVEAIHTAAAADAAATAALNDAEWARIQAERNLG